MKSCLLDVAMSSKEVRSRKSASTSPDYILGMQSVDVQAFKDVLKRCLATCQDGDLVQVARGVLQNCPFPDTQTSGLTYGGAISHIAVGSVTQFSACRARGVGVAGRPAAAGSGDPVATRPFDVFRQQRASAVRAVVDEIPRRGTARDRVVQGAVPRPPADVEHVSPWSRRRHRRGARARVRHCPLLCGTKCLCVGKAGNGTKCLCVGKAGKGRKGVVTGGRSGIQASSGKGFAKHRANLFSGIPDSGRIT